MYFEDYVATARAGGFGRGVDMDNGDGFQCWDLGAHYAREVCGSLNSPWLGTKTGSAKDIYRRFDETINPRFFDRIANDKNDVNQVPRAGDLMVADGTFGHVCIFLGMNGDGSFTVLEQWGGDFVATEGIRERTYTWRSMSWLGWLRPKVNIFRPTALRPKERRVSAADGIRVRAQAAAPAGQAALDSWPLGTVKEFAGFVHGQLVDQDGVRTDVWFVTPEGTYSWSGGYEGGPDTHDLSDLTATPAPTPEEPAYSPADLSWLVMPTAADFPAWVSFDEALDADEAVDHDAKNRADWDYYWEKYRQNRPYSPEESHVHWPDAPAKHPTHQGTVEHLLETKDLSADFVTSPGRITRMGSLLTASYTTGARNMWAWTSENAIIIDGDTEATELGYKTLGLMHYVIEKLNPRLRGQAIRLHKEFMATSCSDLNVIKIRNYADMFHSGELLFETGQKRPDAEPHDPGADPEPEPTDPGEPTHTPPEEPPMQTVTLTNAQLTKLLKTSAAAGIAMPEEPIVPDKVAKPMWLVLALVSVCAPPIVALTLLDWSHWDAAVGQQFTFTIVSWAGSIAAVLGLSRYAKTKPQKQ
jgi:hypothetical protein